MLSVRGEASLVYFRTVRHALTQSVGRPEGLQPRSPGFVEDGCAKSRS